jgi:hypothetical protein
MHCKCEKMGYANHDLRGMQQSHTVVVTQDIKKVVIVSVKSLVVKGIFSDQTNSLTF